MKHYRISILAAIAALGLSAQSCDFLETDPTNWYGENVVYSSTEHLDLYVNGLYTVLYANADIAQGYIFDDCFSDLVKQSWYGVGGGAVNKFFYTGVGITPDSNMRSNWGTYTYIRQLNEFFYDLNYGYMSKLDPQVVAIREAEIRFLRAFAYQELVLRHGGVILRIDEHKVDGPEENSKARSSEKECWDFILGEYDKAAAALPLKWEGTNRGRITKGAALGMKARAALYAGRYDVAIKACDDLFALEAYSLVDGSTAAGYNAIFTQPYNPELILPVYYAAATSTGSRQHNFNQYFCPPGDGLALNVKVGGAATPTDEYASAFDIMVDGKYRAFDWKDLDKYTAGPFTGRDPRFYANILYNGAVWKGRTLQTYVDGDDSYMDFKITGQENVHKTTTGYYFRKFLSDASNMNYTSILSGQFWIEMRLAEIYLIKSEASARQGFFADAYDNLNIIRKRAGMPALPMKTDWDSYVEDLSKERVCELGMEGHRYFDLIRWGLAQKVMNNVRLHGIKITKKGGALEYQYVEVDTSDRLFPEKFNIYPIPYTEIKANSLCEQNPGW